MTYTSNIPIDVEVAARTVGDHIATARKRRKLTQASLGRRMGNVSRQSVARIEKGEATVELGSVLRALWALGLLDDYVRVAEPTTDATGQTLSKRELAKRVRSRVAADPEFPHG